MRTISTAWHNQVYGRVSCRLCLIPADWERRRERSARSARTGGRPVMTLVRRCVGAVTLIAAQRSCLDPAYGKVYFSQSWRGPP
jgi:hypothetical protein